MFELQKMLFEKQTTRTEFLNYKPVSRDEYVISIYRNHSFELVEHTISAYLDYAGIRAKFEYSDYDDSLSFLNINLSADLIIIWLDLGRYQSDRLEEFITERINYLCSIYKGYILYIPFRGKVLPAINEKVVQYNLMNILPCDSQKYMDIRLEKYTGTFINYKYCMKIAKDLGLNYIPSLLRPLLKAVIVDLDNTLYKGVLGEDGEKELYIDNGYIELQKTLKKLSQEGFFLCIASKNNEKDVREMFENRMDFPLEISDFTKICASWNEKRDSIREIAKFLNIDTSSMLFIDDNLGEIVKVKESFPEIHCVLANENSEITSDILKNYPGFLKLNVTKEDTIRKTDILANRTREEMKKKMTIEEYLKLLDVHLVYSINVKAQVARIAELSNKTNQFIFNYKRYTPNEIENIMDLKTSAVISITLKDKLSDSGIVGTCVLKKKFDKAIMEECFVSCRALGRGLDEAIVLGAIKIGTDFLGVNKIKVEFKKGERNVPAEEFYKRYFKEQKLSKDQFLYEIPKSYITYEVILGK